MARRGRKRKWGTREKSDRPQRKKKKDIVEERVRLARNQPHRRSVLAFELKSNEKTSELAESPLGRLSLRGLITPAQRAAGELFARIVARYQRVIDGPRPVRSLALASGYDELPDEEQKDAAAKFDCPSQYGEPIGRDVEIGGRRVTVRTWPCQLPGQTCACLERREAYMRSYEAIAGAGRAALVAVIAVAVRGEEPSPATLVNLKTGLEAAKRHLRLTEADGERSVRN